MKNVIQLYKKNIIIKKKKIPAIPFISTDPAI